MATATYKTKDQHWQNETTIYWFDVEFKDQDFDDSVYGVSDCGGTLTVVDCDGAPVDYNQQEHDLVAAACVVTDEMVKEH